MDDYQPQEEDESVLDDVPLLPAVEEEKTWNLIGFWMLGLCNNFAYVIMLSAAQDILESDRKNATPVACKEKIIERDCTTMSTGSVLLADIIPALIIKLIAPLFITMIPFGTRHLTVLVLQALSYILVALGDVSTALFGVVLASFASGLGEISYLALASYFKSNVISAWSSGTGGAGIIGALSYAVLTDQHMMGLTPRNALLNMLIIPLIFAVTYWGILRIPATVHRVNLADWSSCLVNGTRNRAGSRPRSRISESDGDSQRRPLLEAPDEDEPREHAFHFASLPWHGKIETIKPLLRFMIPLMLVYYGEYFINQGMFELLTFDCSHGFDLSPHSQYRWYQVLYQLGVFISRSSSNLLFIPPSLLPALAFLQLGNAVVFFSDAYRPFISHILIVFFLIVYEGLLGGAAYVNTFRAVHTQIAADRREFSMGFVSISDTVGIVLAGFSAIPAHNFICSTPL